MVSKHIKKIKLRRKYKQEMITFLNYRSRSNSIHSHVETAYFSECTAGAGGASPGWR